MRTGTKERSIMLGEAQVKQMLGEYNPWWYSEHYAETTPEVRRRAYHETLDILMNEEVRRFVVLSGARRIGKTTVMRQVISHLLQQGVNPLHILYLSFDNPMCKLIGVPRILAEYDSMVAPGTPCYFFFDEIQYADSWSLWLKTLYDMRPHLRLVATGSASPSLEKGASDSGVGRWRVLRMPTLTFREFCDIQRIVPPCAGEQYSPEDFCAMGNSELTQLMSRFGNMQAAWNQYIERGGFPELLSVSSLQKAQMLLREDVADKVLKRDIPSLFDVRNSLELEKVFLYLCLHSGSLINMAEMCKKLEGVTLPTLQRYIQYLADANLVYICHNSAYTGKKGLSAQSKIYVADVALRNACLMMSPARMNDTEMGAMVESIVYKHLRHSFGGTHRLGYVQLKGRKKQEVDFALTRPTGEHYLCEVKYRNDSSISREDAIAQLCNAPECLGSLLLTRNDGDYGVSPLAEDSKPITRIPAAAFCYLLSNSAQ